jgi:hypothetical protein
MYSYGNHYEVCRMLASGYHNRDLCIDINPRKGVAYVWYLDGTDRIDFEPIKLGQPMDLNGERKFKRRTIDRDDPWRYEW